MTSHEHVCIPTSGRCLGRTIQGRSIAGLVLADVRHPARAALQRHDHELIPWSRPRPSAHPGGSRLLAPGSGGRFPMPPPGQRQCHTSGGVGSFTTGYITMESFGELAFDTNGAHRLEQNGPRRSVSVRADVRSDREHRCHRSVRSVYAGINDGAAGAPGAQCGVHTCSSGGPGD